MLIKEYSSLIKPVIAISAKLKKKMTQKIRNYLVISLICRTFALEHLAVPIGVRLAPCGGQKIGFEPLTD
jgi:hypothetical protein